MKKILCLALLVVSSIVSLGAPKFSEGKNISVVTREDGSGTKSAFMELVKLKGKADPQGVIVGTGTAGVLAEVKGNPNALAYESLGYVTNDVKKIKVEGVEATIENIKAGTYKIARPLNVIYKANVLTNAADKAFYEFLQSKEAQDIITKNGYVSTKDAPKAYTKPANSSDLKGEVKISGSTSLQPLMIILAGEFEKIHVNCKVTVSGGGSGTGYQNAENGTSDFGMISEVFKKEKAQSCTPYEVAKDGIAMIVNKINTTDSVTLEQLKNIYNAEQDPATKIKTWADLKK